MPTTQVNTDFKDYFNLQAVKDLLKAEMAFQAQGSNRVFQENLVDIFYPPLKSFLEAKREVGELSVIANGEGHDIAFLDSWNGMVENSQEFKEDPKAWPTILKMFSYSFVFHSLGRLKNLETITEDNFNNEFLEIVKLVNKGDTGGLGFTCHCRVDDIDYNVAMKNWNIQLTDWDTDPHQVLPILAISSPKRKR